MLSKCCTTKQHPCPKYPFEFDIELTFDINLNLILLICQVDTELMNFLNLDKWIFLLQSEINSSNTEETVH
jgi:hypothetical protein